MLPTFTVRPHCENCGRDFTAEKYLAQHRGRCRGPPRPHDQPQLQLRSQTGFLKESRHRPAAEAHHTVIVESDQEEGDQQPRNMDESPREQETQGPQEGREEPTNGREDQEEGNQRGNPAGDTLGAGATQQTNNEQLLQRGANQADSLPPAEGRPTRLQGCALWASLLTAVPSHPMLQTYLTAYPNRWTVTEILLGFPRGTTLPRVNEILQLVQNSPPPQETTLHQQRQTVHPELQPLTTPIRTAIARGLQESEKISRQARKMQDWHHHGITAIIAPVKNLGEAIRKYACNEELGDLDTRLEDLHQRIVQSAVQRRIRDPGQDARVAVQHYLLPVLGEVDHALRGQINAVCLFENLLACTEVEMLLRGLRKVGHQGTTGEDQPADTPPRDHSRGRGQHESPRTRETPGTRDPDSLYNNPANEGRRRRRAPSRRGQQREDTTRGMAEDSEPPSHNHPPPRRAPTGGIEHFSRRS